MDLYRINRLVFFGVLVGFLATGAAPAAAPKPPQVQISVVIKSKKTGRILDLHGNRLRGGDFSVDTTFPRLPCTGRYSFSMIAYFVQSGASIKYEYRMRLKRKRVRGPIRKCGRRIPYQFGRRGAHVDVKRLGKHPTLSLRADGRRRSVTPQIHLHLHVPDIICPGTHRMRFNLKGRRRTVAAVFDARISRFRINGQRKRCGK